MIYQANGSQVQAQCFPLNPLDSNGVQWLELSFLATCPGPAEVVLEDADPSAVKDGRGIIKGEEIHLENEFLRVRVRKTADESPLSYEWKDEVEWGRQWLEVNTHQGMMDRSIGDRTMRVLREGPLRTQVELEGQLAMNDGQPGFHYRLTIELWAGLQAVKLDWMLAHQVAGVAAFDVSLATLAGEWLPGIESERIFCQLQHGLLSRQRIVKNPDAVTLEADSTCGPVHVADPKMLLDDEEYPFYLAPPKVATEAWLGLSGPKEHFLLTVADFAESRPNRLASSAHRLDYQMIPSGHPTRWPQGRRRQQNLVLTAEKAGEGNSIRQAVARLSKLTPEWSAQPSSATLIAVNQFDLPVVLGCQRGRNIRLNSLLHRVLQLSTPAEKWDLGDTVDSGYTQTYPAIPNRRLPLPGAPALPFTYLTTGGAHMRLKRFQSECLVEPVWTNNEYDVLHALALEIARTEAGDHGKMLRWAARHNLEVDFICYSDHRWLHRASGTHSARHTTSGAHPSHFWTQGLLQYYLLSGDRDALEVAKALGDKIIENLNDADVHPLQFTREEGWGLLSLVSLVEVTRDPRYMAEADRLANFLQNFDRASFNGKVKLSLGREGAALERQMIDNCFGFASMIEAMDRYQKLSQRQDTAKWLVVLLNQLKDAAWDSIHEGRVPSVAHMVTLVMAIGYERTANLDFLRVGLVILDDLFDSGRAEEGMGRSIFQHEVKPAAMTYRALVRFLGHADRADLLTSYEFPSLQAPKLKRIRFPKKGK